MSQHIDAHAADAATFDDLGISPKILAVLAAAKFTTPTPIQRQAIPVALADNDVVGIAQTGTGKTLAFAIPMLQRIARTKGQGLIVLPTRELALQVEEELKKIGGQFGLRVAVLIGGASMDRQIKDIKRVPHIFVVTPGRLIDHLDQRTVSLERVNTLVLDEADRMLDMGFMPQIKRILQKLPEQRQTMMFSATMPPEITRIAERFMKLPTRIEVARAGSASKNVTQELFVVEKRDKVRLLKKILDDNTGSVLVFTRTKHGAKKLTRDIIHMGHKAAEIHGNRSLAQRKQALGGFKTGTYRVLVATDIAARGIDVTGISLVINFDLPDQPDDYVHRIGRTGRASHQGHAIALATPDQGKLVTQIEKLTRQYLPISKLPEQLPHFDAPRPSGRDRDFGDRDYGRGGRGGFGGGRSGGRSGGRDFGRGGRRDDRRDHAPRRDVGLRADAPRAPREERPIVASDGTRSKIDLGDGTPNRFEGRAPRGGHRGGGRGGRGRR